MTITTEPEFVLFIPLIYHCRRYLFITEESLLESWWNLALNSIDYKWFYVISTVCIMWKMLGFERSKGKYTKQNSIKSTCMLNIDHHLLGMLFPTRFYLLDNIVKYVSSASNPDITMWSIHSLKNNTTVLLIPENTVSVSDEVSLFLLEGRGINLF